MSGQNIFTQTGANSTQIQNQINNPIFSTQIQNQINNPIFIVPENINIRKVFFKNREIIKISAILFPLLLSVSFAISFGFEEIFLYFIVSISLVVYVYAVVRLNRKNGEEAYNNAYMMYITSSTDGLSGLLNRRTWYEKSEKIFKF